MLVPCGALEDGAARCLSRTLDPIAHLGRAHVQPSVATMCSKPTDILAIQEPWPLSDCPSKSLLATTGYISLWH